LMWLCGIGAVIYVSLNLFGVFLLFFGTSQGILTGRLFMSFSPYIVVYLASFFCLYRLRKSTVNS
jgi:hypothetical protein